MIIIIGRKSFQKYEILGITNNYEQWLNNHCTNGGAINFAEIIILSATDKTAEYNIKPLKRDM